MNDWNPTEYVRNASYVAELGLPLIELLQPQPGERVLDLGCGDGALTLELQNLGCQVVGIDASAAMIAAARARGLNARTLSAEQLDFSSEFDAVFTNAALHWMHNHQAVAHGTWTALQPGGRFVGEFGGHGNIQQIISAIEAALTKRGISEPNPWNFPDAETFRNVLTTAGFTVELLELFPRPTALPADLATWLQTFAKQYLALLPAAQRRPFIDDVSASLRDSLCDTQGNWVIDHVRLRFSARKPD